MGKTRYPIANPLIAAVEAWEKYRDTLGEIQTAILGDGAFDEDAFDQRIGDEIEKFVEGAALAVYELPPRARVARLNALWGTFEEERRPHA